MLSTSEEQGDFVARLIEQQGAELDVFGGRLGSGLQVLKREEVRLSAFAFRELLLGHDAMALAGAPGSCDEHLVVRRCGFPSMVSMTVDELLLQLQQLNARTMFGAGDPSLLWMLCPSLPQDPRSACLLSIPGVQKLWLKPMHDFCAALQPQLGSSDQRAQVRALLDRCGWAEDSAVVSLVLDTLHWDTVELLHFALELLRRQHDALWLPLAKVLEVEFGRDSVLALRKLVDPELTLVLVVAAPDQLCQVKKQQEEEGGGGGGGGGGEEEEEEEEEKRRRRRRRKRRIGRKRRRRKRRKASTESGVQLACLTLL